MLIVEAGFIAAALATGIAIGGHCAAFSGREQRREDRAARDRAVEKAVEWQNLASERAVELAAVREELEAEQLAHHEARERSTAELLRSESLPGWMQAAFLPLSCEFDTSGNVIRFPDRAAV